MAAAGVTVWGRFLEGPGRGCKSAEAANGEGRTVRRYKDTVYYTAGRSRDVVVKGGGGAAHVVSRGRPVIAEPLPGSPSVIESCPR